MSVYGKDFAAVYNSIWFNFSARLWPFLSEVVRRRAPGARTWLDLCCGTGHLLAILSEEGYSLTGLDASPCMLKHAKENVPSARLVRGDVRSFDLGQRFDVITCLFDSLNYLTQKRDLERAFRCARRHLAPNGLFAFDLNTYAGLQENWRRVSTVKEANRITVAETSFDERCAQGRCLMTGFVKHGRLWRRFEEEHIQRGYRPAEVDGLLQKAGLAFRKYDGRTLSRPRKRSGRLVYVCSVVR
jgi:predicted TPR repeat methyltransferase